MALPLKTVLLAESMAFRSVADIATTSAAQLRHAYAQLAAGTVMDQKAFADGLLAPEIERLEKLNKLMMDAVERSLYFAEKEGTDGD